MAFSTFPSDSLVSSLVGIRKIKVVQYYSRGMKKSITSNSRSLSDISTDISGEKLIFQTKTDFCQKNVNTNIENEKSSSDG
jgi:hypothetical protein